jgi:RNA:NAD 2'-phosphotransferase (TPT1/KptA family)
MKLLIMQFSPASCHFLSLITRHSPQHSVLKLSLCSFIRVIYQVSHPYKPQAKLHLLTYLVVITVDVALYSFIIFN